MTRITSYSYYAQMKRAYRKRRREWNQHPERWGKGSQAIHSARRWAPLRAALQAKAGQTVPPSAVVALARALARALGIRRKRSQ